MIFSNFVAKLITEIIGILLEKLAVSIELSTIIQLGFLTIALAIWLFTCLLFLARAINKSPELTARLSSTILPIALFLAKIGIAKYSSN